MLEKMDVRNGENREDKTLEGCYDFDLLSDIIGESRNEDIENKIGLSLDSNNILSECNRDALSRANYFGIKDNSAHYILSLFILYCIFYHHYLFNTIRQGVVMGIFIYSLKLLF